MQRSFSIGKPNYIESFATDLANNFNNHFLLEGKQIFLSNVIDECQIYAMDICLHFKQESGGIFPDDWINHIVAETYDATIKLFPAAEEQYSFDACLRAVKIQLNMGTAQSQVEQYYSKFR
ncbi:MAG: hypothetical protein J6U94_02735 [Paludibacteraceae bacterium]|nr:hypothetical protein [Paludibacteraceae bacterium]